MRASSLPSFLSRKRPVVTLSNYSLNQNLNTKSRLFPRKEPWFLAEDYNLCARWIKNQLQQQQLITRRAIRTIQIQLLSKIPQRQLLFIMKLSSVRNDTYFVENCRSHYHIMRRRGFGVRISRKKASAAANKNLKKLLRKVWKYDKIYNWSNMVSFYERKNRWHKAKEWKKSGIFPL